MQDINAIRSHTTHTGAAFMATGPERLRNIAAHLENVGQFPTAAELRHFADELTHDGVPTPESPAPAANGHRPLPPADLERLLASVRRGTLADLLGDVPVRITIDLNPRE